MIYRRTKIKGGTYFFTVVTYNRRPFLCDLDNVELLRQAFQYTTQRHPMKIDAFVLLPDHLHSIWTLPENDHNFSMRWRLIKSHFSRHCQDKYNGIASKSRRSKQERAFWQRRFWEHTIRNDQDFAKHVEYIHYNPVKHGLVIAPKDWKYSSFHRYVRAGFYDEFWGADGEIMFVREGIMLGYAKLFKEKILAQGRAEGKAEGRAEVYRELQQAQREGITLEDVLKTHDAKNGKNEGDEPSS